MSRLMSFGSAINYIQPKDISSFTHGPRYNLVNGHVVEIVMWWPAEINVKLVFNKTLAIHSPWEISGDK